MKDLIVEISTMINIILIDLEKSSRGFEVAAQRVRVNTIKLNKLNKKFREQSVKANVMLELRNCGVSDIAESADFTHRSNR